MNESQKVRCLIGIFIAGLVISGFTAFPLQLELEWLSGARGLNDPAHIEAASGFDKWILTVRNGLRDTYAKYPWMGYGTDWLAFAHLVIALFFIAPLIDPVRNIGAIYAGLAACVLVIPLALICGHIRQIPFGWRLIDCSFGAFGALPLLYALKLTKAITHGRSSA